MTRIEYDDLGHPVALPDTPSRVVSLVPSLTEAIAATAPEILAGATEWCTHPPDLDVPRYRGTKNPDVRAIIAARPDLVVLNKEENRELDHRRLTQAGIPTWVTVAEDVDGALHSLHRLITIALARPVPPWLTTATGRLAGPPPPVRATAAICVWRDPWMVAGPGTFAADLLRRLGIANAYAGAPSRYPHVDLPDLQHSDADLIILPDEPYPFAAHDGPEEFPSRARLISGRHLTWYGPSLVEAVPVLERALRPMP